MRQAGEIPEDLGQLEHDWMTVFNATVVAKRLADAARGQEVMTTCSSVA